MADGRTAIMAAMLPVITAAATPQRTTTVTLPPIMADIDRATMLPPTMVLGIGGHTHTTVALGTTVGIVTVGDRKAQRRSQRFLRPFCAWSGYNGDVNCASARRCFWHRDTHRSCLAMSVSGDLRAIRASICFKVSTSKQPMALRSDVFRLRRPRNGSRELRCGAQFLFADGPGCPDCPPIAGFQECRSATAADFFISAK